MAGFLLAMPPAQAAGPGASWPLLLQERLAAPPEDPGGALSFYVRDLGTGLELGQDAESPAYLSSAIKVVVMLEVLRQADAGALSLDDVVVFRPEDVRDGIGPIGPGPPGRRFTLARLLELMIVHSDNAAADRLMARVGLDALNRHPRWRGVAFGPIDTLLGERRRVYARLDPRGAELDPRQIRDLGRAPTLAARARLFSRMVGRSPPFTAADLDAAFRALYAERVNSASMREVWRLLEQVASCERLGADSCRLAHRLLRACKTGQDRILAGLPRGADWAHKTGTQQARACDVGILFARPDRPIVVAACTRDFQSVGAAARRFARLGRAVWELLGAPAVRAGLQRPSRGMGPTP